MRAIKTHFDGKSIKVPKELRDIPPGDVLVIVAEPQSADESQAWLKAQETAFAKVWENDEDAIYDSL